MAANGHTLEIDTTRVACAGAAAAFLVRTLGTRAGGYAPGIQDRILRELATESDGGDLTRVARWFDLRTAELARLGNRMGARMVAFETTRIMQWVIGGQGHRGAVLVTAGDLLHPGAGIRAPHAVAVTAEIGRRLGMSPPSGVPSTLRTFDRLRTELAATDPWPGIGRLSPLPPGLEEAHRRCLHRAFLLYSYGWS